MVVSCANERLILLDGVIRAMTSGSACEVIVATETGSSQDDTAGGAAHPASVSNINININGIEDFIAVNWRMAGRRIG